MSWSPGGLKAVARRVPSRNTAIAGGDSDQPRCRVIAAGGIASGEGTLAASCSPGAWRRVRLRSVRESEKAHPDGARRLLTATGHRTPGLARVFDIASISVALRTNRIGTLRNSFAGPVGWARRSNCSVRSAALAVISAGNRVRD